VGTAAVAAHEHATIATANAPVISDAQLAIDGSQKWGTLVSGAQLMEGCRMPSSRQSRSIVAKPTQWHSPYWSVVALGVLALAVGLLGWRASDGTPDGDKFATSVAWDTWVAGAGLAILLFTALGVTAGVILFQTFPDWGIDADSGRRAVLYTIAALLVAVGVYFLQVNVGAVAPPDLPVAGLTIRVRAVVICGLTAGALWVAVTWLAQDQFRAMAPPSEGGDPTLEHETEDDVPVRLTFRVGRKPAALSVLISRSDEVETVAATAAVDTHDDAIPEEELAALLIRLCHLWDLIKFCVGAFALGVVAALATTGALRGAYLSYHPECTDDASAGTACANDFPATNVLLYGAAFAVLLTIVAAPLVIAWRARALQFLNTACPIKEKLPDAEWVGRRDRLKKILQLDTPILRNPLIALSIFVPLVTSTLAAFIPQLART